MKRRGYSVCPSWCKSFAQFLQDMGRKPSPDYALTRIDKSAGFSADNCEWSERAATSRICKPHPPRLSVHSVHLNEVVMSRGLGRLQNGLLAAIRGHGKPMTFADIRAHIIQSIGAQPDEKLRVSFERSLRRALHRLTSDHMLIAMGEGGPGEPLRYFIHPLFIGMMGDTPQALALREALEADSGANEAAAGFMARMLKS
jgi:hypothetical protein